MNGRSAFAGGDQAYLRDKQYNDSANLDARIALHQRFTTADEQFPDFAANLVDWSRIQTALECGCGTGRFWENRHAPRSVSLTLTDLSPGMADTALKAASASGFESVSSSEADVQRLAFDAGSYDLVVANHMLYHVPDPDQAIAELARVLRPEGTLLASTNGVGHMKEIVESVAEVFGSTKRDLYEVFGLDSGERRLRACFRSVSWHAYDNDLAVTDLDTALAYCLSYPPGETANDLERQALAGALERRAENGVLRVRTRTGAFVCRHPR